MNVSLFCAIILTFSACCKEFLTFFSGNWRHPRLMTDTSTDLECNLCHSLIRRKRLVSFASFSVPCHLTWTSPHLSKTRKPFLRGFSSKTLCQLLRHSTQVNVNAPWKMILAFLFQVPPPIVPRVYYSTYIYPFDPPFCLLARACVWFVNKAA